MRFESDALVVIEDGVIAAFGPFDATRSALDPATPVTRYGDDSLIAPGFIDLHVHYPQTQMIGAWGKQLLEWLETYTFVAEQQFSEAGHAHAVAKLFLRECLRAGTTTAMVYCTVHPESVDAFFEESAALGTRMIAGKVLMDRNAPAALLDTAQRGYDESKALIARWHGRGRNGYAITPRFAATSTPAQLDAAGALWKESPGTWLQSHVAETHAEGEWVKQLFPERRDYLDVYDHHGLLGPRAVYGHGIWLSEAERRRCFESDTAIAHCPTSNLFLGSGLLAIDAVKRADRPLRVGLGTDLGAGTSFSQLATMKAACEVAQLRRAPLAAPFAWYLATRGAAHALHLEDTIGSIAPGCEADLVVLDLRSTPLIEFRMGFCRDLAEQLFVQIVLADERATRATWIAGELRYERERAR